MNDQGTRGSGEARDRAQANDDGIRTAMRLLRRGGQPAQDVDAGVEQAAAHRARGTEAQWIDGLMEGIVRHAMMADGDKRPGLNAERSIGTMLVKAEVDWTAGDGSGTSLAHRVAEATTTWAGGLEAGTTLLRGLRLTIEEDGRDEARIAVARAFAAVDAQGRTPLDVASQGGYCAEPGYRAAGVEIERLAERTDDGWRARRRARAWGREAVTGAGNAEDRAEHEAEQAAADAGGSVEALHAHVVRAGETWVEKAEVEREMAVEALIGVAEAVNGLGPKDPDRDRAWARANRVAAAMAGEAVRTDPQGLERVTRAMEDNVLHRVGALGPGRNGEASGMSVVRGAIKDVVGDERIAKMEWQRNADGDLPWALARAGVRRTQEAGQTR